MRALVVYATRKGSTREVAEAVAAALREQGMRVDVASAQARGRDRRHELVVVGGALYLRPAGRATATSLNRLAAAKRDPRVSLTSTMSIFRGRV